MIILFAILAIAAIAGFAIPTAIRNGLPKENYTCDARRKSLRSMALMRFWRLKSAPPSRNGPRS